MRKAESLVSSLIDRLDYSIEGRGRLLIRSMVWLIDRVLDLARSLLQLSLPFRPTMCIYGPNISRKPH